MVDNGLYKFIAGLLCLATAAALVLIPTESEAVDLTDGIRFGAFSIHPALASHIRYVDNVYFVPNNYIPATPYDVPQQLEADFVVNVQPSVLFDISIPTFTFQTGYRFYNDNYLGYDDPDGQHNKLNSSNHTANALIDYQAPFGLLLKLQDIYTIQETFEESKQYVDYLRGEQSHNDARGLIGFTHGPEKNLYFTYTYVNILDQYSDQENEIYNKMTQFHQGEARLKFFPRTAIVINGQYGLVDYTETNEFDSSVYEGMAGLQGQITSFLLMTLKAGYSFYDYNQNEDAQGVIGNAEFGFVFPSLTRLSLGYRRQYRDAINTNFYLSDEAYLDFTRLWFTRLTTDVFASYQLNEFSDPDPRHEDFLQVKFDMMVRLVFWLYTGAGYQLEHKVITFEDQNVDPDTITRNIIMLKVLAQF